MLKETQKYVDFDGKDQVEDLYFNISKTEIIANLDLEDQFRDVLALFDGGPREWDRSEVERFLHLIKHVMRLSYGERSADGKRFRKSPEIWNDFQDSAVYDAYLFSLFTEPEKANRLLTGVLPADLRAEAQREMEKQGLVTPDGLAKATQETSDEAVEPTDEELLKMHPLDMTEAQKARAFTLRFGTK